MKKSKYQLILTSRGLNTNFGAELIENVLRLHSIDIENLSLFLVSLPEYEVDERILNACLDMGVKKENIYFSCDYENGKCVLPNVTAYYITEGNTFLVQSYMRTHGFYDYIREKVKAGALFIGASAGAIISSWDTRQALPFDSNYSKVSDFTGLRLMPKTSTVIPHYTYKQLKRFIKETAKQELVQYSEIYNIANNEALIMDIELNDDVPMLVKKKRVRLE